MTLDHWMELGAVVNVEHLNVTETILGIWDAFGHDPETDPATQVGLILFPSEVEPFREWIASMEGARGLYFDEFVYATLRSDGGRRFIVACGECWAAMIENGIPGLSLDSVDARASGT